MSHGAFAKTLRWLGVLLPMVLSYPVLPVHAFGSWFRPRVIGAVALWLVLAFWLLIRRDWRGAASITTLYMVVEACWLLFSARLAHPGRLPAPERPV